MSLISQNVCKISKVVKDIDEQKRKRESDEMGIEEKKEMKKLESFLFGSLYEPIEFVGDKDAIDVDDPYSFFSDQNGDISPSIDDCERKPVWVDEEDEKVVVDISKVNRLRKLRKDENERVISGPEYVSRLRAQHAKLNPGTNWAQPNKNSMDSSSSDELDDANDILCTNEEFVVKNGTRLLPGLLEYSRLVDANREDPSNSPINSVEFHRNAQLLLAGGLDRWLRFFHIDGKRNTKIQSVFFEDCPIRKASFLPDGSRVIVSGRKKFFYSFDLVKAQIDKIGPLTGRDEKSLEVFEVSPDSDVIAFAGNDGYILLVSTKTKDLIGTLKMNGTVTSLGFADGMHLLSSGGDGHIYSWDLRTRTCLHKGIDEGNFSNTALCTSPMGGLFASGSECGIVNVYNRAEFLGGNRKPLKVIENLTTKVSFMRFNYDARVLAICSCMKKNSLKLVHVPSFTVFSNWPMRNQNLRYPRCVDFSPGGGFIVVGNAAGKVMLYKLHHYQNP